MTHDVIETDSHTVIDEFFQNNVYLRKFEDNMESEFHNQESNMFQDVASSSFI